MLATIALSLLAAKAEAQTIKPAKSVSQAICQVFGSRCGYALRIARCESHLNPRAVGSAGERGAFQIHPIHFGWVDENRLWDPVYNAKIAYRLSRGGTDWSAWTCRRYV